MMPAAVEDCMQIPQRQYSVLILMGALALNVKESVGVVPERIA